MTVFDAIIVQRLQPVYWENDFEGKCHRKKKKKLPKVKVLDAPRMIAFCIFTDTS